MMVIVDYGMGNLRSVEKAFQRIGQNVIISSSYFDIEKATRLVLPGVGNFERGIENLRKLDLITVLNNKVLFEKIPVLGICLGMQLMTGYSEEGNVSGLNWIDAKTVLFNNIQERVPHMGWNTIKIKKNTVLSYLIEANDFFYFVHSYRVVCNDPEDIFAETYYGLPFHSGFIKNNIVGVQFHPEKSHLPGLQVLKNFISYNV